MLRALFKYILFNLPYYLTRSSIVDQSGTMRDKEKEKRIDEEARRRDIELKLWSWSIEVYKYGEEKRKKTRREEKKKEQRERERESSISDRIVALLSVAAKRVATFYIVWLHSPLCSVVSRICASTTLPRCSLSLFLFFSLRNAPRYVALEMAVFLPTIA